MKLNKGIRLLDLIEFKRDEWDPAHKINKVRIYLEPDQEALIYNKEFVLDLSIKRSTFYIFYLSYDLLEGLVLDYRVIERYGRIDVIMQRESPESNLFFS